MVFTENTAKMDDVAYQKNYYSFYLYLSLVLFDSEIGKMIRSDGCGFIFGRGFSKDGMTIVLELFYIRIYET